MAQFLGISSFILSTAFSSMLYAQTPDMQWNNEKIGISFQFSGKDWVEIAPTEAAVLYQIGSLVEDNRISRACIIVHNNPFPEGYPSVQEVLDPKTFSRFQDGVKETLEKSGAKNIFIDSEIIDRNGYPLYVWKATGQFPSGYPNETKMFRTDIQGIVAFTKLGVSGLRCSYAEELMHEETSQINTQIESILASFNVDDNVKLGSESTIPMSDEQIVHNIGQYIGMALGFTFLFFLGRGLWRMIQRKK